MKKRFAAGLLGSLILISSGCSSQVPGSQPAASAAAPSPGLVSPAYAENTGSSAPAASIETSNTDAQATATPFADKETAKPNGTVSPAQTGTQSTALDAEIVLVKQKLKKGQTKDEVKALLGEKYAKIAGALEVLEMWRYDLSPVPGYRFDVKNDQVDTKGMSQKKVAGTVYITWTAEGTVKDFVLLYPKDDSMKRMVRVNADGEVKEEPLIP